jgi:hypothetical protein
VLLLTCIEKSGSILHSFEPGCWRMEGLAEWVPRRSSAMAPSVHRPSGALPPALLKADIWVLDAQALSHVRANLGVFLRSSPTHHICSCGVEYRRRNVEEASRCWLQHARQEIECRLADATPSWSTVPQGGACLPPGSACPCCSNSRGGWICAGSVGHAHSCQAARSSGDWKLTRPGYSDPVPVTPTFRLPGYCLDTGSCIQEPGSWGQDPGSRILDACPRILHPWSWILDPGALMQDPNMPVTVRSRFPG